MMIKDEKNGNETTKLEIIQVYHQKKTANVILIVINKLVFQIFLFNKHIVLITWEYLQHQYTF